MLSEKMLVRLICFLSWNPPPNPLRDPQVTALSTPCVLAQQRKGMRHVTALLSLRTEGSLCNGRGECHGLWLPSTKMAQPWHHFQGKRLVSDSRMRYRIDARHKKLTGTPLNGAMRKLAMGWE